VGTSGSNSTSKTIASSGPLVATAQFCNSFGCSPNKIINIGVPGKSHIRSVQMKTPDYLAMKLLPPLVDGGSAVTKYRVKLGRELSLKTMFVDFSCINSRQASQPKWLVATFPLIMNSPRDYEILYAEQDGTRSWNDNKNICATKNAKLCTYQQICPLNIHNEPLNVPFSLSGDQWVSIAAQNNGNKWVQVGTRAGGKCNPLSTLHSSEGLWMNDNSYRVFRKWNVCCRDSSFGTVTRSDTVTKQLSGVTVVLKGAQFCRSSSQVPSTVPDRYMWDSIVGCETAPCTVTLTLKNLSPESDYRLTVMTYDPAAVAGAHNYMVFANGQKVGIYSSSNDFNMNNLKTRKTFI
jgi:hypothetical protein